MDNQCDYKNGTLESCAPLAAAFVPVQENVEPTYAPEKAIVRGTLFPGLDLPFMDMVNQGKLTGTPMGEVMALDFVCAELILYLDTHENDIDAFAMLQKTQTLAKAAKERYLVAYGPLTHADLSQCKSFTWLREPWPWNDNEMEGR